MDHGLLKIISLRFSRQILDHMAPLLWNLTFGELMSEEEIERKIAVIFATDVVGYSKHMEADESSTIYQR